MAFMTLVELDAGPSLNQVRHEHPRLLTGVAVSHRDRSVLQRLVVHGDTGGDADFVCTCVPSAYGTGTVVHGDKTRRSAQTLVDVPSEVVHPVFFEEGEDGIVNGGNIRLEFHDAVRLTFLFGLVVGVVNHVPDDPVNAKRGLNHMRNVPLAGFLDGFLIRFHMFFFHADGLAIGEFKVKREGGCFRKGFEGRLTMPAKDLNAGPALAPSMVQPSISIVLGSSNSLRALNVRPVAFS